MRALTGDHQMYLLARDAEPVVGDADVDAGVVAVQRHDLQRAVRQQPIPVRGAVDLIS